MIKAKKTAPNLKSSLFGTMTKRQKLEMIRQQMWNEQSSYRSTWMELAEYVAPRRVRFFSDDVNRGERRNGLIIDNTAGLDLRTLKAGMMGGVTSPARRWFKLESPDPSLNEQSAVKEWLYETGERMTSMFNKSNLYNAMPILYGDMGQFSIGGMLVEEDMENVMRFTTFPVGSYFISVDSRLKVNTFYREFQIPVRMVVDKFGKRTPDGALDWEHFNWENFSDIVQIAIQNNQWNQPITIRHFILPNDMFDPRQIGPKGKKFASIYYEVGSTSEDATFYNGVNDERYLRESGYDHFPFLCGRWEVTGEDSYGDGCPGIDAIGDVKMLQVLHERLAQALEKIINPPLVGSANLVNKKVSLLPGDITYDDSPSNTGLRPIHQVQWRVNEIENYIAATQKRIDRSYYTDLFLMMSNDDRAQPPTATEVVEKKEEKLLAVGPVLEQLNQDVLDPLIELGFQFMWNRQMISPPPPELHGVPLRIVYTSVMAEAQKLLGISSTERFFQFTNGLVNIYPSIVDNVDVDSAVQDYGDKVSINPKILRDPEVVAQIRAQRQQAQQAQQQQQQMAQQAETAKHLSQADTGGDNALTQLMQTGEAGNMAPTK